MRIIIMFGIIVLTYGNLWGQDDLYIYQDDEVRDFAIVNLHKMTFVSDSFYIHLKDERVFSYNMGAVSKLSFDAPQSSSIKATRTLPISIYPNPVSDVLNFSIPAEANGNVSVLELNGRMISSQILTPNNSTINVSHLRSDIYLLRIQIGETVSTKLFIKE